MLVVNRTSITILCVEREREREAGMGHGDHSQSRG